MADEAALRDIKRRHSAQLRALPGVCGVGIEKDESGTLLLAVHVDASIAGAVDRVPRELEGVPVKIVPSGPFNAQ